MKINIIKALPWRLLFLGAVSLGLLAIACGPAVPATSTSPEGADSESDSTDQSDNLGAADSGVTSSGLEYIEVEAGSGPQANAGDLVTVHYTGTLEDGTEFDSSAGGDPIQFVLGEGRVIPGWDEGIALMRVGGKAQLIIPPELGYGAGGFGPIPPDATLYFDVELVAADPVPTVAPTPTPEPPTAVDPDDYTTTESGLQYYFLEEGDGETPLVGEVASVAFVGWLEDGQRFANTQAGVPIQFIVGDEQIIAAWDEMALLMQVGDLVQMIVPPELGLGETGSPNGVVPPNATLIFELELVAIEPPPPTPTPAPPPTSIDESDFTVTESGLKYFNIINGSGELIQPGDLVTLHYRMWLEDGTQIESSYDFGQPVQLIAGNGQAGPGWDEALLLMSSSSLVQFILTPELAYGVQVDNAPTEGNLIFEVEIIEVTNAETE